MNNTFDCHNALSQLPVPNLHDTCNKLMAWAKPLLNAEELDKTKKVISEFLSPGGEGELLQNELITWAKSNALTNWSAPVWKELYLEARDSLVINHNVFYYLKSKLDPDKYSQAHIAAALIGCVSEFMMSIDRKTLSVDMQNGRPLCMNQYRNLFSVTRIPRSSVDELKVTSDRTHIIALHKGHMFKVNIADDNGLLRNVAEIESDLEVILTHSTIGQNIGILTTLDREVWAEKRTSLLAIREENHSALAEVENAAFVLCLDRNSPEAIEDVSKMLLHGDGQDRFFDKALQFIVFNNGKTGINFEHSGVDGSVMLRLVGYIYDNIDKISFTLPTGEGTSPEEVAFSVNDKLSTDLIEAKYLFNEHIDNTRTRVLNFSKFGKELIKTFKVSPDAFVQLALQLAEYKLYGKCYSAYEAIMTRGFLDGRIDVLYTVSPESIMFINNILSNDCSDEDKIASLLKATKTHIQRANECRTGNGIYTHFLALESRYKAVGNAIGIDNIPAIFTDKGYQALFHSVVCTSTTSEYGVELAGYGPIVDDGYGIRYFKRKDSICFNLTSRTVMQDNLEQMCTYIEESLTEMAALMQKHL